MSSTRETEAVVKNVFSIEAPVEDVFDALLDLERVTPALPGAKLLEHTASGAYKVAITVRLGPVSMTYRGDVRIVATDPGGHTATMVVKAKETRGQGSADAEVTVTVVEEDGQGPNCSRGTIEARVRLAGRAATMGRGIIDDVSAKLVETFAENLSVILAKPSERDASRIEAEKPSTAADSGCEETAPEGQEPQPDAGAELAILPLLLDLAAERLRTRRGLTIALLAAALAGYVLGRRKGR